MSWGEEYQIDYELDTANGGGVAKKVALVRLASTTHGFDQSQRYVPLTITEWDPTDGPQQWIKVSAPPNGNHAPPGLYMLFILNEYAKNQFSPCMMAAYVLVGE